MKWPFSKSSETLGNVAIDKAFRCECYSPLLHGDLKDVAYGNTHLIAHGRRQRHLVFTLYFDYWHSRPPLLHSWKVRKSNLFSSIAEDP